ncbi:hypothetical protein [Aliiruegeria lutimaris]|uniref:NnrT protein n=1 Tax=Aliiruegeria lutimaris TaxID=571298 RepID=A0A1G8KKZ7_9RHOB|nr:hypothetical protein [Aliiruegeria lutimaris]SDI44084.1 hypothetical protein SAMN04488026_100321 [Aliiruegeria lutimaris]
MPGTKASRAEAGKQVSTSGADGHWSIRKLAVLLYPFAAATVAINLFMLGLMGQAIGLPAISPALAIWASLPLGIPAGWMAARWVRGLMDEAERRPRREG